MSVKAEYRKVKIGQHVYLSRQLETTGGLMLARGLLMKITNKHKGLHLASVKDKPCKSCGITQRGRIAHVLMSDVVVLPAKMNLESSMVNIRHVRRVVPGCQCLCEDSRSCALAGWPRAIETETCPCECHPDENL